MNSRRSPRLVSSSLPPLAANDSEPSAAAEAVVSDPVVEAETRPVEPQATIGGMWALFLGLGLLMIGNGLNGAVIGVRSGAEGFSVVVTGVIMAGYFAGFLLAPSLVVRMIPSVGHIRVFAGLASTASSAVLVHAVWVMPFSWTVMRFVFGFCMAGLYIVIESWLGEMSDSKTRGRTLAIYMIVSIGGLGIGQYLVALADPTSFRLFVVSSVLVSMSLVPVTLAATTKAPAVLVPERVKIRELIGFVPTGVIGSFLSGATAGIVLGLAAVYATAIDLSLNRTALFLVAPTIGAIVLQWPIGRLSDKVSRRSVIFGVCVVAMLIAITMALLPEGSVAVSLLMVGLGGMLFPLYSLVVSYTLDWTPEGKMVGASGTLVRINGCGALIGPLIAAPLMAGLGPEWFFVSMAGVFGVMVVYLAYRLVFIEALPQERQRDFVPFPARAGAMAINLVVKPVRKVARRPGRHGALPQDLERDIEQHPSAMLTEIFDGSPIADGGDSPIDGP
jgi:MFS family permease